MKTQINNVVRADALVPGQMFYDLIAGLGHLWTVTAVGPDQGSEVRAFSMEDYRVTNFGEAQLVWAVEPPE